MRKDVLAKCYQRRHHQKKKLLEKQKEGQEKMRQLEAPFRYPLGPFWPSLKLDDE